MIKEAYVSFEVAKLLKEKGFNELCFRLIREDGEYIEKPSQAWNGLTKKQRAEWYIQPTHQMACAWLREKHFIIVVTPVLFNVEYENSKWGYDIWADDNLEVSSDDCSKPLATYEEATEEALKYVLENLL